MPISQKDLDPAFLGAGQKEGLEIWRIENFRPVPVEKTSYGKFFTGDSYIILKSTASKNGSLRHDIHYWLGKETSQDESGSAAIKTVELDAALGSRAVQYRELQGHETEKFLSYFRPCIIPQPGGFASGFKHAEVNEHEHVTRLYVCKGKHVVNVTEVPFARSTLNHDDIFILDTKSKIFQFNGSNSSIQERAKALEVVQYLKDSYHSGKCDVAAVEDGRMMADAEAGEFWGLFGGFAPLPRKATQSEDNGNSDSFTVRLLCMNNEKPEPLVTESFTRDLLDTNNCYMLDCGSEIYVWMGRNTSLQERTFACTAAEKELQNTNRVKTHIVRTMEGFETVTFKSKFDNWQESTEVAVSEEGRSKVAAILKRQGLQARGAPKAASDQKEEFQPHIDCTGNLQVWRVNGTDKDLLSASEQFKFYSGDCYVFQYMYPGDDKDEYLIGTWFGKKSIQEERAAAISIAQKINDSLKSQAVLARFYEGKEAIQFFAIFQNIVFFKGGLSSGYKNLIAENDIDDDTYSEDGLALFRVQGSGPENMQAIQVDPVASSLNSSYCYILHDGSTVFTWSGSLSTSVHQELLDRQIDVIKPNSQPKSLKERGETDQFWDLLGGKAELTNQKIPRVQESEPHLFSCVFIKESLKVKEIFSFTQDDLLTEEMYVLGCHSDIFVWVGQLVESKLKVKALDIAEKFLELDSLMEKLSPETPIYIVTEGNEPSFFTRFFTWNPAKSAMHGDSFQRRLAIVRDGKTPMLDKPKRRTQTSYTGRSIIQDKPQQRSRSMSFSPERVRVRGRSPALNALAATFENPNARNLSTPPPIVKKMFPKSTAADAANPSPKSAGMSALAASFDKSPPIMIPKLVKAKTDGESKEETVSRSPTIKEDVRENEPEDEEGLLIYPYDRLRTTSSDIVTDIDATRRETYLSSAEFKEKFGMTKDAFSKLPKWKQNRLKIALHLF